MEGCYWDKAKQTCLLNPNRKTEGCMKCSDLKFKHTCNSLSNCFWNEYDKILLHFVRWLFQVNSEDGLSGSDGCNRKSEDRVSGE